ncbi:MAG: PLP-dependent aminotransferase family protein [Actinomycetota bacterium]
MATISFARGVPSADLLPVAELQAAINRAMEQDATGMLLYGDPMGYPPLREWVGQRWGHDPAGVFVTNGSLQAFALLAEMLFAGSGGRAAVEAPTYDRTILTLKRFGATVDAYPLTEEGIDVDALEAAIAAGRAPGLVYIIPNFQNPAGNVTSLAVRQRLVDLAAEHGFWLFEDDPYGDLRFVGEDVPRMYDLDTAGRVIYSTSFTKTVAPGVRAGALLLPEELRKGMAYIANQTYIGAVHFAHAAVAEYCAAGDFDRGLARVRPQLEERKDALVAALEQHLGDRFAFRAPEGGYFLWGRLDGVDTDALLPRATEAGVPFVKGSDFFVDGSGTDHLRLAFSAVKPGEMDEGIARLAALL